MQKKRITAAVLIGLLVACDSPETLVNRGKQAVERKDYEAAIEVLATASERDPNDIAIRLLLADAYRLAFNDPEFLNRPETRGVRFQLELLKPELVQAEAGIHNTLVVFGSARFKEDNDYYKAARQVARLVSEGCAGLPKSDRLTICTGGLI